jgi:hypothetical protein
MSGMPSPDSKKIKPAETLREAYQAADPRPLSSGDPYFVDLTKARDSRATDDLKLMITNCAEGRFSATVFSGHRGSGKSTELRRLQQELLASHYTLYLDVNDFLDAADLDYTDLFLLVSRALLDQLRADGVSIDPGLIKLVEEWFVSVTKETEETVKLSAGVAVEAKAGAELPFIARLLAKLTADVKAGSSRKVGTRVELDRYFSGLLSNTNLLLISASEALAKAKRPSQILVLVDNLDRVPPKKGDTLFFAHGSQLQDLKCHVVYTVSIDTFYSHRGIGNVFPNHEILPNVKLRASRSDPSPRKDAFSALREVIEKRINVGKLLTDPKLAEQVIAQSGGSVRQLVRLLREAVLSSQSRGKEAIDAQSIDDAARALRLGFERILAAEDYERLALTFVSKRIKQDVDHMRLLSNTAVLEYNGTDLWHDVNPLIESIDAFKEALAKTRRPVRTRKARK